LLNFHVENFPFPRKWYEFLKNIFLRKKFIKLPYYQIKKEIYIYSPPFSNHSIPHHQRNNPFKNKKKPHFPTLRNNQISPSHATQETTSWDSPYPPKKIISPNPTQKNSFGKWWNYLVLPSSPQKIPFGKESPMLNPSSPFLKATLTTFYSFNLIELSTPCTHWNPIIKNKHVRKEK
jgi:hypothetical protein